VTEVGIVLHHERPAAREAADSLAAALSGEGVIVTSLSERDDVTDKKGLDLVVSVGGDGTFLRAAHIASSIGCPVLGVKVGRVGFLTEVDPVDAAAVVRQALSGDVVVEERLAVAAEPDGTGAFEAQWGMNEIVVEKHARHRLVRLAVSIDGTHVTTFAADGVIVATPTGSTAYSFSARGPILSPDLPCLVLTPIAPHMVFDRAIVLGAEQRVSVEVVGEESGVLSADGRKSIEVPVGTRILIHVSDRPARIVRRTDEASFFARVREKFGLTADPSQLDVGGDG
jgi:NAD+ kinase